jgi:hypothetical protein
VRTLVFLVLMTATAHAATHRLAVLVGANRGAGDRAPLRYAEGDADKLARVLTELGGFAPEDVLVLHDPTRALLDQTLAQAALRVRTWHAHGDDRVILLFYFSGHSDGVALELGSERFAYADLREWLRATGADVRLGIADTCNAGGLIAIKGGTPGPAFDLRLADDLATRGEALLTSSAANEVALESEEIEGSFFTHHLVSALRGAADASGDGVVTLAEAYQYTFAHTVATTADTVAGPQHPAYDYRLSGHGDLVLTLLAKPSAVIELPAGLDRVLVVHKGEVVAEVGHDGANRLAVPAGDYTIRAWRGQDAYAAERTVGEGDTCILRASDLAPVSGSLAIRKGPDLFRDPYQLTAGLDVAGMFSGVSVIDQLGFVGAAVGIRSPGARGWSAGVAFLRAPDDPPVYSGLALTADAHLGAAAGRFRLRAGIEAAIELLWQSTPDDERMSPIFAAGPDLGLSLHLAGRAWLDAGVQLLVGSVRVDNGTYHVVQLISTLGIGVDL